MRYCNERRFIVCQVLSLLDEEGASSKQYHRACAAVLSNAYTKQPQLMTQYFWSILVSNLTSPATTGSADNTQSPQHTSLKSVYKVSEFYIDLYV